MQLSFLTILLSLVSSTHLCFSQTELPKDESGIVVYTGVVSAEGLSKKELYDKAKFWIVSTLKSGDNMVELGGDNSDQIVGTGNLVMEDLPSGYSKNDKIKNLSLNFKFIVFIRDGRYKYELSNFLLNYNHFLYLWQSYSSGLEDIKTPNFMKNEKKIQEFQTRVTNAVNATLIDLIQDFKSSMSKSESSDDW